ncbi:MAG: hypothetical protein J6A37_15325 [Oscillospiraceae bacterium]|nr:hypothetical protein [Oscillospiraceae bacterium]
MLLVIFIIAWLISPIVLGVICGVQHSKIADLEKKLSMKNNYPDSNKAVPDHRAEPYPQANRQPASYQMPPEPVIDKADEARSTAPAAENASSHMGRSFNGGTYTAPPVYKQTEAAQSAPQKPENKGNAILFLGAMFIILAGFVFAAAAWGALNAFFKSVVLLSFSALFYGLCALSEKKLGLETAGKVFYVLGSVFLPIAFGAGAVLRVFGDVLTFSGPSATLTLSVMALLLAVPFFIGAKKYEISAYAKTGYFSLAAFLAFIMIHYEYMGWLCAAAMAVISLVLIFLQPKIEKLSDGVISQEFHVFTAVNTWTLAIISLFISDGGGVFVIPSLLFSGAFFTRAMRSQNASGAMYPMCAYLLAGILTGIRPESAEGYVLVTAGVMIVFTLLGMMDALPSEIREASEKISAVFSGVVILAGFADSIISGGLDSFDPALLISAAMVVIQLGIISVRTDREAFRVIMPISVCWLCFEVSRAFFGVLGFDSLGLASAVLVAYFFAVKFSGLKKRFYHLSCDIVTASALAFSVIIPYAESADSFSCVFCWILLIAVLFASGKDSHFGRIAMPFGFIMSVMPVDSVCGMADRYISGANELIIAVLIYSAAASVMLIKPLRKYSAAMSVGIPALTFIETVLFFSKEEAYCLIGMAAVLIYSAVSLFANKNSESFKHYLGYLLGMICLGSYQLAFIVSVNGLNALIVPAVIMLIIFASAIFPNIYGTGYSGGAMTFLIWAMPVYSVLLCIAACDESFAPAIICAAALTVFSCAAAVIEKNSFMSLIGLIVFYWGLVMFLSEGREDMIPFAVSALSLISALAGRFIYRNRLFEGRSFDMLSLSAFMGCMVMLFGGYGEYEEWFALLLGGALLLNLLRKESTGKQKSIILSAASCLLMPVWWTQPFFELPEIIETELNVLPVAAVCVLIMMINRSRPEPAENISFAAAVVSLLVLFVDAVGTGYAADAVMLGIVIAAILFISFALRRKRWFALSVASAAAEALVLTLKLWNSRTWWIYLLAAGIILTVFGMRNERRKQQGEKSGLSKLMSEWKW